MRKRKTSFREFVAAVCDRCTANIQDCANCTMDDICESYGDICSNFWHICVELELHKSDHKVDREMLSRLDKSYREYEDATKKLD